MTQIRIDTSELKGFARGLKRIDAEAAKALRSSLRAAGNVVADGARIEAGFSSNIPQTIRVRTAGATDTVIAGAGEAHPGESAAFEHNGVPGQFRHPVYGHRNNWVSQTAHPFLLPALAANRERVAQMVADAFDEAVQAVMRSS